MLGVVCAMKGSETVGEEGEERMAWRWRLGLGNGRFGTGTLGGRKGGLTQGGNDMA